MTTHAITAASRDWCGWPSIQNASAMLVVRIAAARKRGARRVT